MNAIRRPFRRVWLNIGTIRRRRPSRLAAPDAEEEVRAMRGIRWRSIGVLILSVSLVTGCQSSGSKRPPTVISPPPTVSEGGISEGGGAEKSIAPTPASTTSFVDRHPLFYKPREYWQTSGDRKIVKAAAATFIGVPAGFVGEFRQIIVGGPPAPRY
jgi:hypothetical protein